MSEQTPLGTQLRALRRSRKLPQIEVATAVGISRSHLAEIEGGKDPGFRTFIELAEFFEISLDELYTGTTVSGAQAAGNLINDPEELTLLEFWRTLTDEEKNLLRGLFRRGDGSSRAA